MLLHAGIRKISLQTSSSNPPPAYSHAHEFQNSVTFFIQERERDIDRKVARDTKMERASSIPYSLIGQKSKEEKKLNR